VWAVCSCIYTKLNTHEAIRVSRGDRVHNNDSLLYLPASTCVQVMQTYRLLTCQECREHGEHAQRKFCDVFVTRALRVRIMLDDEGKRVKGVEGRPCRQKAVCKGRR